MPTISIEKIENLIQDGACKVDDQIVYSNEQLLENQIIQWEIKDYHEQEVDCAWKLLWQNDEILAVHKPANLPVHKTTRNVINTLIKLVQRQTEFFDAHLLHRLDLETSGIVLIAKNKIYAQKWQANLTHLMQKKIYHAVVYGQPKWQQKEFECRLNTKDDSKIRCKMYVQDQGKLSHTKFTLLSSNTEFSIIKCELITGRKHQIRAQLAHLGHPIIGDKIYSNEGEFYLKRLQDEITWQDEQKLKTNHHLLMAVQVDVMPKDGEIYTIQDDHYSQQWIKFCQENNLDFKV